MVLLLPSLHKLSLASRTGVASEARRMIPRPVWQKLPRCYYATFTDGETLILDIKYYTNQDNQDVVSFNVRSGGMFSFEVPAGLDKDTTTIFASDESGHHAWKGKVTVSRMVGRYIVAFAAIIRQLYPQLEQVRYHNAATIDDMDATDLHSDGDKIRELAEEALYRVRYYERLGFEFEVPYDSQLEDTIYELTENGGLVEVNDPSFSGELLSMAQTTIPQAYPKECTLWQLYRAVC